MCRLVICGVIGVVGAVPASDGIPPPRPVDVAALVRELGSDDYHDREAAAKRLSGLALDPPPELLAATRSENPDLRERALRVARAMRWNAGAARQPRGLRLAERGRADLFVAATAAWDLDPRDARLWDPPLALARVLVKKAHMTGGDRKLSPANRAIGVWADLAEFRKSVNPRLTRVDEVYRRRDKMADGTPQPSYQEAIQSAGVEEAWSLSYNLVVSRDSVAVKGRIFQSVVFANGNVVVGDTLGRSVVVCDGDVEVASYASTCLVVARGDIRVGAHATSCTLIAGGKVTIRDDAPQKWPLSNVVEQGERNPLGFVTFFELSTVGVEVKADDGLVTVASVADKKPFAAAGVRVGDVVTAVNGKKPDSAESLRRLLRDALAVGDAAVTLRRGDADVTVKVALPE